MDNDLVWVKPVEINTVQDYVMAQYVPDVDDSHYRAWGYEQWLIKKFKHDFGSICLLERGKFNKYLLSKHLQDHEDWNDALKGKSLVRTPRIIRRFLMTTVWQDSIGIVFADYGDSLLVLFPFGNHLFGPIFEEFPVDSLIRLDQTFTTTDDLHAMQPTYRVDSGTACEDRFIQYACGYVRYGESFDGGDQVFYVSKAYSNSMGYSDYSLYLIPAIPKKKGKGYKKGSKYDVIKIYGLGDRELEMIRTIPS